jgi:hypothetical protein
LSQARAQLRSDQGAVGAEREERVAEVYPFPRYQEARRTVRITGQTVPPPRRRQSPAVTRVSARPDRIAMYAVLLGLVLIVMAIVTAHG